MPALRQYLFSLVAAAIVCGVVSALGQLSGSKKLVRLLCGLFLVLTALQPLINLTGVRFEGLEDYRQQARAYVEEGKARSELAWRGIIKDRCCAYILDEAAKLQAQLEVEVVLSPEGMPHQVQLTGRCSPHAKARLSTIIQEQLGITKENQLWKS